MKIKHKVTQIIVINQICIVFFSNGQILAKTSVLMSTKNFTPFSKRPICLNNHEYCGFKTLFNCSSALSDIAVPGSKSF